MTWSSLGLRFLMLMAMPSPQDQTHQPPQSPRFQLSPFTSTWVMMMTRFHSQAQQRQTEIQRITLSSSDLATITRGSSVKAPRSLTEDPAVTLSRTSAPARSSSMVTEIVTVSLVIPHPMSSPVVLMMTISMALQRRSMRVQEMILSASQWVRSLETPRSRVDLERID